jgi:hypothetical protein
MKVQAVHHRQGRRGVVVVVATVVAMVSGFAGAAGAQVLEQMPADALVAARVSNLGRVSAKVADLAKKLGVDQFSPAMSDPLVALKEQYGVSKGVNTDGDFGFAFIDPEKVRGADNEDDASIVLYIPVTDYKEFLTNFNEATTEGDITSATTPEGEPMFVKSLGKYAAISPAKPGLSLPVAGVKVAGKLALKELEKDVVFIANFDAIRPKVLPIIERDRAKWLAELEKDMTRPRPKAFNPDADPNNPGAADEAQAKQQELAKKFVPVAKAAANTGIDVINAFIRDASSATYSMNLTDAGINGTFAAEFNPDTYAGRLLGNIKGSNASFLSGLPGVKYLFYGGFAIDPQTIMPALNDLLAPTEKELAAFQGDEAKPVLSMIEAIKKSLGATASSSAGLVAPTGPLGQDAIIQQIAITRGDAKVLSEATRQVLESQQQFMSLLQGADVDAAGKTVFTPAARQVDGVTFDAFKTEVAGNPNDVEFAQAQRFLSFLYGPEGLSGLVGAIDDKQVLTVSGLKPDSISQAIKSAKAGEDVLGKSGPLKLTTDALPASRVAAFYVPLDVILGTGLNYAKQNGMQIPVNIPQDLPPIGITWATDGPAARADWHVPTPLVQSVVSAAMQMYMGFAPNQGGPAPAPAAPAEPMTP